MQRAGICFENIARRVYECGISIKNFIDWLDSEFDDRRNSSQQSVGSRFTMKNSRVINL